MKGRQIRLVNELRKNARRSLTQIGMNTDIPLSSVFKIFNRLYREEVIKKNTCLIDFAMLGFPIKIGLFITTDRKDELKELLRNHSNINTLLRLSGDSDFYAEFLFRNMVSYQDFMDELEDLSIIKNISAHFITDIKREEFQIGGD